MEMETIHTDTGELVGVSVDAAEAAGFLARFSELVEAGVSVEDAAELAAEDS